MRVVQLEELAGHLNELEKGPEKKSEEECQLRDDPSEKLKWPLKESQSTLYVFRSFWNYRGLIGQLIRRDIGLRYKGSIMRLLWSLFNPILRLGVYTLVFGLILKTRWSEGSGSYGEFAAILFAGLMVHGGFAECINLAPGLISGKLNNVPKVILPLEVLPWVVMGSVLFRSLFSLALLIVFLTWIHFYIHWTIIFLPIVLFPFLLLVVGLMWILAIAGVYTRSVDQAVVIASRILLFLSPVLYSLNNIPERFRWLFYINPLTYIVEQVRAIVIWGKTPQWNYWALYLLIGTGIAWIGLLIFQKFRSEFADIV